MILTKGENQMDTETVELGREIEELLEEMRGKS